jgi:SAM-dependent methyltransferase
MGRWRALGARSKADHVVRLCAQAGLRPGSLAEIGCGDGALLAELAARGWPVLDGFELSPPAADIARARGVARKVEVFDGLEVPVEDGAYDLAVLSHVLEHVPEPMTLLREAARVAPAVLVEVPLEDNRSARRDEKRAEAARIGHVQFFKRADVPRAAAGGRPAHGRGALRPPPLRPPRVLRHGPLRATHRGGEDRSPPWPPGVPRRVWSSGSSPSTTRR